MGVTLSGATLLDHERIDDRDQGTGQHTVPEGSRFVKGPGKEAPRWLLWALWLLLGVILVVRLLAWGVLGCPKRSGTNVIARLHSQEMSSPWRCLCWSAPTGGGPALGCALD